MNERVTQATDDSTKGRKLLIGILLDLVGYASFALPVLGEVTDVVWAPMAGFFMTRMYKGTTGKIGGIVAFLEEILPGLDFIPTFTLTWLYTYVIAKDSDKTTR